MRLNKFLAQATGISRREADAAISSGRVQINGQVAILGQQCSSSDVIELDGKPVVAAQNIYLALHKPAGYICSRKKQGNAPTIYSLLPQEYQSLKTVGRLDKDSSGIILLTNDGDFAQQMTHPKFMKRKEYIIELDKPLTKTDAQAIINGEVMLDDGVSTFELTGKGTSWNAILHEGRNRQIRRTFAAIGYTVKGLHRVRFGDYSLTNVPEPKDYAQVD